MFRSADELSKTYNIPPDMVIRAAERGVKAALYTNMGIFAQINWTGEGGLEIYALSGGQQRLVQSSELSRKIKRKIVDEVEKSLLECSALVDAERLKNMVGSVFSGTIDSIRNTGEMLIHIQLNGLLSNIDIFAECPVRQQPIHERGHYHKGQTLEWYVTSCTPISNGNHAKTQIITSRITRQLPEILLKKLSGIHSIRCIHRVPGICSKITTRKKVPYEIIAHVGKTLREHINVRAIK